MCFHMSSTYELLCLGSRRPRQPTLEVKLMFFCQSGDKKKEKTHDEKNKNFPKMEMGYNVVFVDVYDKTNDGNIRYCIIQ